MSVNQLLRFSAQFLFIALSVIALVDYVRHRDRRRRDFALLACSLGIPLGIAFLKDRFGIQAPALDLLGALVLFTQPYFLFRLLQYYRPSPAWMHWAVLLGMALCWAAILLFYARAPLATQVVIFGYCVIVDGYCTWEYSRGAQRSVGILRRRLAYIALSAGLFTLAVAGNVVNALLPSMAPTIGAFGLAITAVSAILYYLAFLPPRWLRNAWQFEELAAFLEPITATKHESVSIAESFRQLCVASNQEVNGMAAAVVRWDKAAQQWTVVESTDPTLNPGMLANGQTVIDQVWQQRRPQGVTVREIAQAEERRGLQAVGAASWLLVPILTAETIWGVLVVLLRERSLFIDVDLSLLELFAQQCAIVVENRRLIDELQGYSTQLEGKVKARSEELSESEARFRHLADSAPALIWMTDAQGRPIYFNQQWYDFIGLSPPIGAKLNWFHVAILAEDAQKANNAFVRGHRTRAPFRQEYRLRRHDGVYRWLLDSALPRIDHNGEFAGYAGSILDITDLKNAEKQIKESEAALRELNATLEERIAQRTAELQRSNDELGQFAYVASHALKAPLRAVHLLAGWIQQDVGDALPSRSQEHLVKLQERVRRMETLVYDLLAYSRVGRESHAVERVDIAELIHSVFDILAPPPGFALKLPDELPVVQTERTPLETVFQNLIGNAIKHHDRAQQGSVEVRAHAEAAFVEFTVSDDGPGIAPEHHQRIFEIFKTLQPRDESKGSGIGLAIVKKAVEGHGGAIHVEPGQGQGVTFRFTWPVIGRPDEDADPTPAGQPD